MLREDKSKVIDAVRDRIDRMQAVVLTDYQGIDVEAMNTLRGEFYKAGVEYTVVKNTLVDIAIEGRPFAEHLRPHLKGMTALAWTFEDPGAPARVIRDFQKKHDAKPVIKCGVVGEQFLEAEAMGETADLPTLDQARARILNLLQTPAQRVLTLLSSPARNIMNVLGARKADLEEKAG
jgi:large subunit ribosomal protein L10